MPSQSRCVISQADGPVRLRRSPQSVQSEGWACACVAYKTPRKPSPPYLADHSIDSHYNCFIFTPDLWQIRDPRIEQEHIWLQKGLLRAKRKRKHFRMFTALISVTPLGRAGTNSGSHDTASLSPIAVPGLGSGQRRPICTPPLLPLCPSTFSFRPQAATPCAVCPGQTHLARDKGRWLFLPRPPVAPCFPSGVAPCRLPLPVAAGTDPPAGHQQTAPQTFGSRRPLSPVAGGARFLCPGPPPNGFADGRRFVKPPWHGPVSVGKKEKGWWDFTSGAVCFQNTGGYKPMELRGLLLLPPREFPTATLRREDRPRVLPAKRTAIQRISQGTPGRRQRAVRHLASKLGSSIFFFEAGFLYFYFLLLLSC